MIHSQQATSPAPQPESQMATATIQAGAKLQLPTGQWATLKTEARAEVLSERYGIYKILINGKRFSVDYKHVEIH
jgi:hypothetical protein